MAGNKITYEEFQYEQYQRIIEARNFHYESFSRWQNFFYMFVGALFIAFYSICGKNYVFFEYCILALGYICSLFAFLSCRGYTYWWIHWNSKLTDYETNIFKCASNDRNSVFQSVCPPCVTGGILEPANVSTTKVATCLWFVITLVWGLVLAVKIFNACLQPCENACNMGCACTLLGWAFGFIVVVALTCLCSAILVKVFQSNSNPAEYIK